MADSTTQSVANEDVSKAVSMGQPLSWTVPSLDTDQQKKLSEVLAAMLDTARRPDLKSPVLYCLHELLVNAQKAMIKRVYFSEKGLDINRESDYAKGIADFKEAWLGSPEHWQEVLVASGKTFQVLFQMRDGNLTVIIANACGLLPAEHERIKQQSIVTGDGTDGVDFLAGVEPVEGGGLGIRLVFGIIGSLGGGKDALTFRTDPSKTVVLLRVPVGPTGTQKRELTAAIAEQVETLPAFPEHVIELQLMIGDPDVDVAKLAKKVAVDPTLTAMLFKIANSAAFRRAQAVQDVATAIKNIGMRELLHLLYFHGAQSALGSRYKVDKSVMDHAADVAAIAHQLARRFSPEAREMVYAGGLLHDLGKIVVHHQHHSLMGKASELCARKHLDPTMLENLAFGVDHAELGALVAERWNFPVPLRDMIRFHHTPGVCPAETQKYAQLVYLADQIPAIAAGKVPMYLADAATLERFGIADEAAFQKFADDVLTAARASEH